MTREDWLRRAREILVRDGVSEVKILTISEILQVSRSSFYWYFKSRKDLLNQLLDHWEQSNTGILVQQCALPAESITESVCNLFRCFIDPEEGFDHRLDFAVREWSRRSKEVRAIVAHSDGERLEAIASMFTRHGYSAEEADTRARVLYYMQIGYYALDLGESLEMRLQRVEGYLLSFTGREPLGPEVEALKAFALKVSK